MSSLPERVEFLESQILSVDKGNPGLSLRMDRQERFTQALIWLAGLSVAGQVLEIARSFVGSAK